MKLESINYKNWFYEKALRELEKISNNGRVIPYPLIYQRFSWMFHFTKEESFLFLKELRRKGFVRICGLRGVKLNKGNSYDSRFRQ
ncbi:MAG: hypothetical protein QXP66_01115 [Candidatus Aenigmatarchaeota archaeon]